MPESNETCAPTKEIYLIRLNDAFVGALGDLGVEISSSVQQRIESMADFIYESMSTSARNYHHVQHVFDVIECHVEGSSLDSVAVLAILFHDCIYAQVDGALSPLQKQKLEGAIEDGSRSTISGDSVLTFHRSPENDRVLRVVLGIFGFEDGHALSPNAGQNEFLSAVIAVRELEPLLNFRTLVQIAACIEATIPFRAGNERGQSALDLLYDKLRRTVTIFEIDLTEEKCVQAVQRAAMVANSDVGNFASPDHKLFIDKTWSLLPESNAALRHAYTVYDFQSAVFKMYAFFTGCVKAELIFQDFRGVPSSDVVDRLTYYAARNIQVGTRYLAAKLVSTTFLAAFAELTGGDAPISLFMGDMPVDDTASRRLEEMISFRPANALDDSCVTPAVRELLVEGRSTKTTFDMRQSPLAAYFYNWLGDDGVRLVVESVKTYPVNPDAARTFLSMLPRDAVVHLAEKLAELVTARKQAILKVVHSL